MYSYEFELMKDIAGAEELERLGIEVEYESDNPFSQDDMIAMQLIQEWNLE